MEKTPVIDNEDDYGHMRSKRYFERDRGRSDEMKQLMGYGNKSPVNVRKSDPATIERVGGGSPEIVNKKLNYFTGTSSNS